MSTEGTSQVRSWWDEGQPFVRTISTLPADILWASTMNKGVLAAPPRTHFGSVHQPLGQSGSGSSRTGGKEHGEVVVEPGGGRSSSQHWPQQGLRADAARAAAIGEIGASRRIPRAALADYIAALTEEPRWQVAAAAARIRSISMATAGEAQLPWVTGPTGAGSARRLAVRRKARCSASCETCGPSSIQACQFPTTGSRSPLSWIGGYDSLPGQVSEKTFDSYADTVRLHIKPSMGRGPAQTDGLRC